MIKIVVTDDPDRVQKIREQLQANNGYCPCRLLKNEANKCMCKEFKDMVAQGISGECHCGLYKAVEV